MAERGMKLYGPDGTEIMEISGLERKGATLVVKGMIMGSMPMTAMIRPEEMRRGLRLTNMGSVIVLLKALLHWQ